MSRLFTLCLLLGAATAFFPIATQAQNALTLFTDCNCNKTLIKQRLDYVNHSQDPANAQVYLFITTQFLPQGGKIFKVDYTGQKDFSGSKLDFELATSSLMTDAEVDLALTNRIEIGLLGFLAGTPYAKSIKLEIDREAAANDAEADANPPKDHWNSWIFEIFSNASFNKEALRKTTDVRAGLRIERSTPELRVRVNPFYSYWSRVFTTSDGEELTSFRKRIYLSTSVVKSISNHWSVGIFGFGQHHSFNNIQASYNIAPAIEFNFFDYAEVPFKEFTIAYRIGLVHNDYIQETVFFKESESLISHNLNLDLRLRQKWGNVFSGLSARAFQQDFDKRRLSLNGRCDVRVFKGLSLNFSGRYELINDQINLPLGDASLEDILLGQTQLATNFETDFRFGLSYTFGSVFNNTVNTRL